ncbi:MAG: RagB/SusD family nutrient uptake outer membrane protein [Tannerella sp.]|jgi:hypothetical protein|nr:RagB/SusD family nutrient uptake outer membrane protein [Tannerella sp.]
MKQIKKYITLYAIAVALLMTGIFSACESFLDEVVPQGTLLSETYMNDEATAEKAVAGLYGLLYLTSGSGPDGNWVNNHYECYFGSMTSDDAEKGSQPEDYPDLQRVVTFQFSSTFEFVNSFYIHGFWGVARANYVLGHLVESPIAESVKRRMEGEGHFFRAYWYFYLLRHYGGVPIMENEITPEDFGNIPRASYHETIEFIIKELKLAAEMLPDNDRSGRASNSGAKGLMARVMLYQLGTDPEVSSSQTSWQALYDLTGGIINSGEYSLVPNYATLFEERADGNYRQESLFDYCGKDGWLNSGQVLMEWMFQGVRNGSWYGWGFNQPTQDLRDAFDPTDPRLSCTIYGPNYNDGIVYGGTTNYGGKEPYDRGGMMMTYYYNRKAAVNGINALFNGTTKAMFVIRYADILLMHAEAAYYIGNEGKAREMVNMVRARARNSSYCKGYLPFSTDYTYPETMPNIPDITSTGEQLLQDIWNERRLELAMENFRTYDLVRTGRLVERVGVVKDDRRTGGKGPLNTNDGAELEMRIPNIRENIKTNSIHVTVPGPGGGERYIPVFAIPPTEVTYWNIDPNPNN